MQKDPERMQALLEQLVGLFEQGLLEALPYVAYDVRHIAGSTEAHGEWAARWQASGAAAAPA